MAAEKEKEKKRKAAGRRRRKKNEKQKGIIMYRARCEKYHLSWKRHRLLPAVYMPLYEKEQASGDEKEKAPKRRRKERKYL